MCGNHSTDASERKRSWSTPRNIICVRCVISSITFLKTNWAYARCAFSKSLSWCFFFQLKYSVRFLDVLEKNKSRSVESKLFANKKKMTNTSNIAIVYVVKSRTFEDNPPFYLLLQWAGFGEKKNQVSALLCIWLSQSDHVGAVYSLSSHYFSGREFMPKNDTFFWHISSNLIALTRLTSVVIFILFYRGYILTIDEKVRRRHGPLCAKCVRTKNGPSRCFTIVIVSLAGHRRFKTKKRA